MENVAYSPLAPCNTQENGFWVTNYVWHISQWKMEKLSKDFPLKSTLLAIYSSISYFESVSMVQDVLFQYTDSSFILFQESFPACICEYLSQSIILTFFWGVPIVYILDLCFLYIYTFFSIFLWFVLNFILFHFTLYFSLFSLFSAVSILPCVLLKCILISIQIFLLFFFLVHIISFRVFTTFSLSFSIFPLWFSTRVKHLIKIFICNIIFFMVSVLLLIRIYYYFLYFLLLLYLSI